MLKRTIQIISGIAIAACLFASYSDKTEPGKLLIWYILSPQMLKVIAWLALFFVASRLVWGKPKDYSPYFYNLFVKILGDPRKKNKPE